MIPYINTPITFSITMAHIKYSMNVSIDIYSRSIPTSNIPQFWASDNNYYGWGEKHNEHTYKGSNFIKSTLQILL